MQVEDKKDYLTEDIALFRRFSHIQKYFTEHFYVLNVQFENPYPELPFYTVISMTIMFLQYWMLYFTSLFSNCFPNSLVIIWITRFQKCENPWVARFLRRFNGDTIEGYGFNTLYPANSSDFLTLCYHYF